MNGNVDVTLPADTRARVKMKTHNGEIYTDFDVRLEGAGQAPNTGRGHRGESEMSVSGAINGGGPEMTFTSFNGRVYLRKKK
jgi:hypothetical protein